MADIGSRARRVALAAAFAVAGAGPALSQVSSQVDSLIRGSGDAGPVVSAIDLDVSATKRYAIVVGNSDYAAAPHLPNAVSDAEIVADFLRGQGYDVREHANLTKRGFEAMLREAMFDVSKDTEVVLFFAGHGFQIGSENYLVPVDATFASVYDVPFETVSLGSVVNIIGARARLQVVILDSCRDNPFAGKSALTQIGNELRETRTGFASLAAPLNSLMIYSTSPGAVALDGAGANSPFTAALVEVAAENPDMPISDVFEEVRRRVYRSTGGRQVPWDSSTLIETARFGGEPGRSGAEGGAGGTTRGIAIASTDPDMPLDETRARVTVDAVLEAPFEADVAIGQSLIEALNLPAGTALTVTGLPETADVVLEDPATGIRREARGQTVASDALDGLLLVARSVQIPAIGLARPEVGDLMTLAANGEDYTVGLRFEVDACDFEAGDHLDPDGAGLVRYANEIEPQKALEACEAAVARAPDMGRFHYQKGRALRALRRFPEARAEFEIARDLGHARAWNALANAVVDAQRATGGEANQQMPQEALALLARGVNAGDPYAYYALGRQFMRYSGDPNVEIEGYDLMMRALEVGHTFAMNELGFFYLDETGDYYDPERGLRYLRESAAREDIYGYNNMGLVYARGLGGLDVDFPRAEEYFRLAAEGGHPNAPANLARMYQAGQIGNAPDLEEAVRWYDVGLERGDGNAGGAAAYLIATEGVPGYQLYDGAIRAAKVAALRDPDIAAKARDLLGQFPPQALDAAAQAMIADLGVEVTVDGQFGAGSQAALEQALQGFDVGPPASDRVDRLVQLAKAYWTTSPFRVDLF